MLGFISPLIDRIAGGPVRNAEMESGRILRNKGYNQYAAMTPVRVTRTGGKDEAQRSRSRFSAAFYGITSGGILSSSTHPSMGKCYWRSLIIWRDIPGLIMRRLKKNNRIIDHSWEEDHPGA